MFETGIHLWLQSLGSRFATLLLTGVSQFGYLPTYAGLIVTLAFGFRLKPGLAVLGAVLLTGVVTDTTKNVVAFPRPDQIDSRLMRTPASGGEAIVARGGASSFWGVPTAEAIDTVRAYDRGNYGFPSSHVSAALTFLLCTAWFMRARWMYGVAAFWVPLMAVSRIYLGRHFLADVLGGIVIALLSSAIWIAVLPGDDGLDAGTVGRRKVRRLWLLALALLVLTFVWPAVAPGYVGAITGLAFSYTVLMWIGSPADGGTTSRRMIRVLLALTLFATSLGLAPWALAFAGEGGGRLGQMIVGLAVTGSTFAGTILLSRPLRLFDNWARPESPA